MIKNKTYPYYDIPDLWTLRELVENGEKKGEDVTALYRGRGNDIPITFGEVSGHVSSIGNYLLSQGIVSTNVAILGENSTEWILTFLAITNSGNCAVPLDRGLPVEDIAHLIGHCECTALFYSAKSKRIVDSILESNPEYESIRLFALDEVYAYTDEGVALRKSGYDRFSETRITKDTLASIVYTSGTSGDQKGVMLTHGNLTSDVVATCRCANASNTQLLLPLHHTFAWASAMLAIFVYVTDMHISSNLRRIVKDLQRNSPQNISAVPMMVEMLYNGIWNNARREGQYKKLRHVLRISNGLMKVGIDRRRKFFGKVLEAFGGGLEIVICGGAPLDPEIQKGLYDLGITVLAGYGITECSPVVAVNRNHDFKLGSVGKPLPCNKVKIDEPDAKGIGEILVSGTNVMLGYYKNPEATAEVFDGEWFRTGDFGRIDEDGFLFIMGRKKNLIILANGENVAPEELEARLIKLEYVKEVAVYEESGKIAAEFFLDEEEYPDAQSRLDADVKVFNKSMPQSKNIGLVKVRNIPFEKTTTMKIKRALLGNDITQAKQ